MASDEIDPSKVRGVEIRIECFHCAGSGRVRANRKAYEANGEMVSCPVCGGSRTTRKLVPLSMLYDLLHGNLRPVEVLDEPPAECKHGYAARFCKRCAAGEVRK